MDWLTFVSNVVGALAWPSAALVSVFLLRAPLRVWLSERPSKLKVGPFEAEWTATLSRAETALEQPGISDPRRPGPRDEAVEGLVQTAPALAVIKAADDVEAALASVLGADGVARGQGLAALAQTAQSRGLITARTGSAVENLTTLRNLAVRSPDLVTERQARGYVALAAAAVDAITAVVRLRERLRGGADNVTPEDVETLLEQEGPGQVVELVLESNSDVKMRQAAAALAQKGLYGPAIDVAVHIANLAEARSVARAALRHAAENPERLPEAWDAIRRLWPGLGRPQRRNLRDLAASSGIDVPADLAVDPVDGGASDGVRGELRPG